MRNTPVDLVLCWYDRYNRNPGLNSTPLPPPPQSSTPLVVVDRYSTIHDEQFPLLFLNFFPSDSGMVPSLSLKSPLVKQTLRFYYPSLFDDNVLLATKPYQCTPRLVCLHHDYLPTQQPPRQPYFDNNNISIFLWSGPIHEYYLCVSRWTTHHHSRHIVYEYHSS